MEVGVRPKARPSTNFPVTVIPFYHSLSKNMDLLSQLIPALAPCTTELPRPKEGKSQIGIHLPHSNAFDLANEPVGELFELVRVLGNLSRSSAQSLYHSREKIVA